MEDLFQILKGIRDNAINDFTIVGEVREKYKDYDQYLENLQEYINDQESKIIEINENLALEHNEQVIMQLR